MAKTKDEVQLELKLKLNFVWQGSAHHSTAPTVAV
jgi:hypothetical protein